MNIKKKDLPLFVERSVKLLLYAQQRLEKANGLVSWEISVNDDFYDMDFSAVMLNERGEEFANDHDGVRVDIRVNSMPYEDLIEMFDNYLADFIARMLVDAEKAKAEDIMCANELQIEDYKNGGGEKW